ncbi:MAG: DEAD/DEAH box helicase, partial [Putridiphycobacter sp.]
MDFNKFGLNKHILKAISEMNYSVPTEVQVQAIPIILDKQNVVVKAQTGTGKTAAFGLPLVQSLFDKQESGNKVKKAKALVVLPTRELALQIFENIKSFSKYSKLKSVLLVGGESIDEQVKRLKGGTDILISTPGRLLDLNNRKILDLSKVEILVFDEADLMFEMGFQNDVLKINNLCPTKKQVLLFSVTMPDKVAEFVNSIFINPQHIHVSPSVVTAQNITQKLFYVPIKHKNELLLHLLNHDLKPVVEEQFERIFIFRRTKYGVEKLEKLLSNNGFSVDALHGSKTQSARKESIKRFKQGKTKILIATDLAARGLDIDHVEYVINFDLPVKPEVYIHRIGRTARAENKGNAISFCSAEEKETLARIQTVIKDVIPVETDHPFELPADAKPQIHRKKSGSKYK